MAAPRAVLAVIDGLNPDQLQGTIDAGRAPFLAEVARRGEGIRPLCAAFPSVTPVCATAIATGALQNDHHIPGMNWWSRKDGRYVEYGSSFRAARRHGISRQLTDTVYRLNGQHLSRDIRTIYERLDDDGIRTAGTTFLVYRGRHSHAVSRESALTRLARTMFRDPVDGPRELFYADLFASRETSCRSQLGKPGIRDQHAGCVSAHLAARDLFDFLLLSLPDNDTVSHRSGPRGQPAAIAAADEQLTRVAEAAGGIDAFLDRHAVVVCSDHAHALVERRVDLHAAFADWPVAQPSGPASEAAARTRHRARTRPQTPAPEEPEIALCPNQRGAMLYVLREEARTATLQGLIATAERIDGVDILCWRDGAGGVLRSPVRGELRFAPGGDVADDRGGRWSVDGDLEVLNATIEDGVLRSDDYPDALRRVWSALSCPKSGDLLLSAAPGAEFADWGGADHVGGGSHGSLHRSDSLGTLLWSGCAGPRLNGLGEGAGFTASLSDVVPMLLEHFGSV